MDVIALDKVHQHHNPTDSRWEFVAGL